MTHPPRLPPWLRTTLYATAVLNAVGAVAFTPPLRGVRALFGLPEAPPLHQWLLAIWIGAFGAAYYRLARTGSSEPTLLAVGAVGKLSFAGLLAGYALRGDLPARAALAGGADLCFGLLFGWWLLQTHRPTRTMAG